VITNSRNLPVLVEEEVPDVIELDPDDVLVPRSEARRLDQIFSHHERFICFCQRLMFGFSTTFDMRCNGTPGEVKGVPPSLDTHPE